MTINTHSVVTGKVALLNKSGIECGYGSCLATINDGFDPNAVFRVCEGRQKTHKGRQFQWIDEMGLIGEHYLKRIEKMKEAEKSGGVHKEGR